ncbi:DedA family protein, partial [Oleiphilus sp. HI0079]|uniref:DedA family protein n=2 Tax=unclassified Oleiphilus TaxID=2631174 RepID=UPI000A766D0F
MDLAQLNLWLAEHSSLILPAVAVIAFVESFAIAGIVVPGVALLFSIAAIASLSHIPVESVLIAAFLGAVAGDVLSFFIGRAFHDRLTNVWPFSRYPDALSQGERFFNKYGTISVVIGRFVGPLRPVLPLTAGMLQMPSAKFITINILSACAWAPAYILPGYLGAEFSQNAFANEHAGLSAWLVVCLI